MIKTKISNGDINNFFKIIKILKKNKKLPLHEPSLDRKDLNYVNRAIKSSQVSTYGKYTKIFEDKIKNIVNQIILFQQ